MSSSSDLRGHRKTPKSLQSCRNRINSMRRRLAVALAGVRAAPRCFGMSRRTRTTAVRIVLVSRAGSDQPMRIGSVDEGRLQLEAPLMRQPLELARASDVFGEVTGVPGRDGRQRPCPTWPGRTVETQPSAYGEGRPPRLGAPGASYRLSTLRARRRAGRVGGVMWSLCSRFAERVARLPKERRETVAKIWSD